MRATAVLSDCPFDLPVLLGTTAVGKTSLALRVADGLNAEIVSADSRQVYIGMEIGSAAPHPDEMRMIPHHLVSCVDPSRRLSAGEYARMAEAVITDVHRRGRLPLVVGGSGLYIRALVDGIAPIPAMDPSVRQAIQLEIDERGMEAMIAELAEVDPGYALKVGVRDRKRLVRALEVWRATGRTFSQWHRDQTGNKQYSPRFFGIYRPRPELNNLIRHRVMQMFEQGWTREVERLVDQFGGYDQLPPTVTEALGYSVIVSLLRGRIDFEKAVEDIVISTRQFAKRQMTWFRADKRIEWCEGSGENAVQMWTSWLNDRISGNPGN